MSARPPLERTGDGALVAGVASGLARHLGVDPLLVRLAFLGLTFAGGAGVLAYGAFWAFVPQAAGGSRRAPGRERLQVPALAAIGLGVLLVLRQVSSLPGASVLWPAVAVAGGIAVVWQQGDDLQRRRWLGASGPGATMRVVGGVALLTSGVIAILATTDALESVGVGLVAMFAVVTGLLLTFAPWWWRLLQDFRAERRARIRSEEKAEMAAHLHDSVLQTLSLIQRQAASPEDVQRLARQQERELRAWLHDRTGRRPETSLATALEQVAADVEAEHAVKVEVVAVGDCAVDERVDALVRAAREAVLNAARFSGAGEVAVFAEVAGEEVTVFVRDTGVGFDPSTVPADRRGIAESVLGRMARHGGWACLRSAPGEGTEVELVLRRESP